MLNNPIALARPNVKSHRYSTMLSVRFGPRRSTIQPHTNPPITANVIADIITSFAVLSGRLLGLARVTATLTA